jgi:hypothetical protein
VIKTSRFMESGIRRLLDQVIFQEHATGIG